MRLTISISFPKPGLDGAPVVRFAAFTHVANGLPAGHRASSLAALFIFLLLKAKG